MFSFISNKQHTKIIFLPKNKWQKERKRPTHTKKTENVDKDNPLSGRWMWFICFRNSSAMENVEWMNGIYFSKIHAVLFTIEIKKIANEKNIKLTYQCRSVFVCTCLYAFLLSGKKKTIKLTSNKYYFHSSNVWGEKQPMLCFNTIQ